MGTGYERPGRGTYVNITGAECDHGDLWTERALTGSVIKQAAYDADSARGTGRARCAIGERVFLRTKGVAEAETAVGKQGNGIVALGQGDPVYIADGSGADAKGLLFGAAAAGRLIFGRVHAVPGVHGCPPGIIRIDQDLKDSI